MTGRITPEQEADIIRRYEAGELTKDIPVAVGVSRATVYNVLDRAGVRRIRPTGPKCKSFTDDELATIDRLRRAGASTEDIGAVVGAAPHRLRRAYEALGLPVSLKNSYRVGSRIDRPDGYVYVLLAHDDPFMPMALSGTRYVAEHRLVMARHLGRVLGRTETVHHINGQRDDNRLENLQLRQGMHGKHAAFQCADCGSRNVVPTTLL